MYSYNRKEFLKYMHARQLIEVGELQLRNTEGSAVWCSFEYKILAVTIALFGACCIGLAILGFHILALIGLVLVILVELACSSQIKKAWHEYERKMMEKAYVDELNDDY